MNYDVSLVITTYNEEKYLPILLGSINNQKTDLKMEIIIIDDSSTDETLNIIKQYEKFIRGVIRLLHNDKKSDVQYMRNMGLKEATGKVIIFFDADTAISENFIENMVKPIIFNMMKKQKRLISVWRVPNRAHTTGIATKTEIARKSGGWKVKIGDGDDAQYSNDVCNESDKVLWVGKCILFISRRRVFPTDNGWITDIFFKQVKKFYKNKIRKITITIIQKICVNFNI